jgi:hypothetical protein
MATRRLEARLSCVMDVSRPLVAAESNLVKGKARRRKGESGQCPPSQASTGGPCPPDFPPRAERCSPVLHSSLNALGISPHEQDPGLIWIQSGRATDRPKAIWHIASTSGLPTAVKSSPRSFPGNPRSPRSSTDCPDRPMRSLLVIVPISRNAARVESRHSGSASTRGRRGGSYVLTEGLR